MTKKPENIPTEDLLDWLGLGNAPNWRVARPLGGLAGAALVLLFLGALAAAFVMVAAVLFAPASASLGTGALLVALLGAPFLIWNTIIRHKTLEFQKEGHITDRIAKAVEQLGAEKTVQLRGKDTEGKEIAVGETKPNIEVRIGGILSLERIAQDSTRYDRGRDHVRVMEILCAYVRENAPASGAKDHDFGDWEPLKDNPSEEERAAHLQRRRQRFDPPGSMNGQVRVWAGGLGPLRQDIQQALSVIGRRDAAQRRVEARWRQPPDAQAEWVFDTPPPQPPEPIGDAPIARAEIDDYKARLADWRKLIDGYRGYRPDLRGTNLQKADLGDAVLSGARLDGARMEGADLTAARMEGANLGWARMEGAYLGWARMDAHTSLTAAPLRGAAVRDVDYSSVPMSDEQVKSMFGDGSVTLPGGAAPDSPDWPAHWPGQVLQEPWQVEDDAPSFQSEWRRWQADPAAYVPPPPPAP